MHSHSEQHNILLKTAPYYSVATAIIISLVKYYSWFTTDSVALLASLMDSLLDLSTSIINFIALRLSLAPPDHNHRFGHNKIEDLAVFGQSVGFFLSGVFTFYNAIQHFIKPVHLENIGIGIYAMIISSFFTILLVIYQSYVIKETKSPLIEADRLHYISDFFTNIAVILSLYLSAQFLYLDALFGIAIACWIVYSSYGLFVRAIKNLIDEELNDDERKRILGIIGKYKEISGVHELKTRYAGSKPFIQFHLEMDGRKSLLEVHMVSDKIIEEIMEAFPGAEVTVHQDPAGLEENAPYREKL